jgi:hypothetical protein
MAGEVIMNDIVELAQTLAVVAAFIGMLTVIGVGAYVVVKRVRRQGNTPALLEGDRLQHLEQAVDAIAVEVERISEAQRFSARLLAERKEVTPVP